MKKANALKTLFVGISLILSCNNGHAFGKKPASIFRIEGAISEQLEITSAKMTYVSTSDSCQVSALFPGWFGGSGPVGSGPRTEDVDLDSTNQDGKYAVIADLDSSKTQGKCHYAFYDLVIYVSLKNAAFGTGSCSIEIRPPSGPNDPEIKLSDVKSVFNTLVPKGDPTNKLGFPVLDCVDNISQANGKDTLGVNLVADPQANPGTYTVDLLYGSKPGPQIQD